MSSNIMQEYYRKHPENRDMVAGCSIGIIALVLLCFGLYSCIHKPVTKKYTLVEGATIFQVHIGDNKQETWTLAYKNCDDLYDHLPEVAFGDTILIIYRDTQYTWNGCVKNKPYQVDVSNPLIIKPTSQRNGDMHRVEAKEEFRE